MSGSARDAFVIGQDRPHRLKRRAEILRQPFRTFRAIGDQILRPDPRMDDNRRPDILPGMISTAGQSIQFIASLLAKRSGWVIGTLYRISAQCGFLLIGSPEDAHDLIRPPVSRSRNHQGRAGIARPRPTTSVPPLYVGQTGRQGRCALDTRPVGARTPGFGPCNLYTTKPEVSGRRPNPCRACAAAAFLERAAPRHDFCTPGMILRTTELLHAMPNPTRTKIRKAPSGNFRRCTGGHAILGAAPLPRAP
jgi:hypothetical protein